MVEFRIFFVCLSYCHDVFLFKFKKFFLKTDKQRIWKEKVENQEYGLISWEDKVISAAIKEQLILIHSIWEHVQQIA